MYQLLVYEERKYDNREDVDKVNDSIRHRLLRNSLGIFEQIISSTLRTNCRSILELVDEF